MTNSIWLLIILILVVVFLIYATKKRRVSWRGSHGIATLTAFHDFQPKDKQEAIEYVMEEKARKKMEEQESGEKDESKNCNSSGIKSWNV
jgi:predicted Holliday junction resolvase-like endonuclease